MNVYCVGSTAAAGFAVSRLKNYGWNVASAPGADVDILLLDVPSFGDNGQLRGGGDLCPVLEQLPDSVMVCGGNLNHPALAGYKTLDLLKDPGYLAQNAYITAEAALDVALPYLTVTLQGCPVLILGWGRIGKCLGQLLKAIGADVTIAARKAADRAMIRALGYCAAGFSDLTLDRFRLIYNTAPELVLDEAAAANCSPDCIKIELASCPGIAGDDVVIALGLPAIHFPESSGALIADTLLRLTGKEESS